MSHLNIFNTWVDRHLLQLCANQAAVKGRGAELDEGQAPSRLWNPEPPWQCSGWHKSIGVPGYLQDGWAFSERLLW